MGTGEGRDRGYDDIVIGRWVLTAPCVKRPDLLSGLSFCTGGFGGKSGLEAERVEHCGDVQH